MERAGATAPGQRTRIGSSAHQHTFLRLQEQLGLSETTLGVLPASPSPARAGVRVCTAPKVVWWDPREPTQPLQESVLQGEPSPTSLLLMEGWKKKHPNKTNAKFESDFMNWTKSSPVPPSQEEKKVLNAAPEAPPLLTEMSKDEGEVPGFGLSRGSNQPKAEPARLKPTSY